VAGVSHLRWSLLLACLSCPTTSWVKHQVAALWTGGFAYGARARSSDGPGPPSIRVGPGNGIPSSAEAPESVFAHWRSVEAWYRDGPSFTRWRYSPPGPMPAARTSPRRDETVVSPQILLPAFCPLRQRMLNFLRLVKRSPALQACNRTRNSQADGAPKALAPGTSSLRSLFPLAAGVMPLKRTFALATSQAALGYGRLGRVVVHFRPPGAQLGSRRHFTLFEVFPQGNQQLACQRHHPDLARPLVARTETPLIPA
jgi:hypothetical protein